MRPECEEIRTLSAELALGIASGEDRARVLEHAAGCHDCRRSLQQLTAVTDQLLLLAPEADPPRGFEERVLAQITPRPARRRLPRRLMKPVLAATVGAALASLVLVLAYSDDHRLANEYRTALAAANGSRFEAVPLRDGAGVKRGSVSLYKGRPSWLVVALSPGVRADVHTAELVGHDGRHIALGGFRMRGGVWGGPLPLALDQVASVQLLGPSGRSELVAFTGSHW